ncbi:MAG: hypothetical protein HY922_15775 [Elusimicrobia bacterium]|nr:hypothetical protein [Elusimicrobiota bacterium]
MKDKVALLMEETGCDRAEAELALELCGYDLESAVAAVPRLFQNILVLKGRLAAPAEALYGLWLAILNLQDRSLLRARAVVSCNPAVYASDLDQHWFDFEGRLYACRLWAGALQDVSQETEKLLASFFDSPQADAFYGEKDRLKPRELGRLKSLLAGLLGKVDIQVRPEVLDMGQFQEVRPLEPSGPQRGSEPPGARGLRSGARQRRSLRRSPAGGGLLVLRIALEHNPAGIPAADLRAGDVVYATITDTRDIAQYLARIFGTRVGEGASSLPAPVEAIERGSGREALIRVRFSAGLCGDVSVPSDIRLRVLRRPSRTPWWKKIFGA